MNIRKVLRETGISHGPYYKRRAAGMSHDEAVAAGIAAARGPYKGRVNDHANINQLMRRWKRVTESQTSGS